MSTDVTTASEPAAGFVAKDTDDKTTQQGAARLAPFSDAIPGQGVLAA